MLTIEYKGKFKKDYKRVAKRGYDLGRMKKVIELLANEVELPPKYAHWHPQRPLRVTAPTPQCTSPYIPYYY